ncbi:MAG: hypothetical protein WCX85_01745 [Bacilli bacterium]|jgi:hypothetical protein|nr:hypothetical protein [Bacilli bacterium]
MTHSQVCDEQLILCYRQNSKEAYDILLNRKHNSSLPLLKKYATQCKPFGVEMSDIYAIFLESFHKAILRFVFEKIMFQTYFLKVLNRDLANFARTISNPNSARNNCFSLDATVGHDTSLTFHDVLSDASQKIDARSYVKVNAAYNLINGEPKNNREETVKRIIILKAAGYSVIEIANLTNLKPASIRRRINGFYDDELADKLKKCLM